MSIMRKDERALDLHQICHLSPQVCGRFLHPAEVREQSGKWKSHNIGSEQHNTTMHNHMQSEDSCYRMYMRLHFQGPDQGVLGKTTKHYVKWYNLATLYLVDAISGSIYGQAGAIRRDDLGMSRPSTHNHPTRLYLRPSE